MHARSLQFDKIRAWPLPPASFFRHSKLWKHQIIMMAAQNAMYGSTMSPARLKQVQQAFASYRASCTLQSDSLFSLYMADIAGQMQIDLTAPDAAEDLYNSIPDHELLRSKCERVNMAKYMQPVQVAKRTIGLFSLKAYIFGAACHQLGYKGADRQTSKVAPVKSSTGAASAADEPASSSGDAPKETLKQAAALPWGEQQVNQLERASYIYGDKLNFHKNKIIIVVLKPAAEYHSRLC